MRIAVLADTHGNLPALDAVLADIRQQSVDAFIIAGDFTGGPQPQETIDRLRSLDGWLIRGNSERYVLDYHAGSAPEAWLTGAPWATFRWSYQRLEPETIDFIAALPEQRVAALDGAAPIRVVHGSPASPFEFLYPDRDPATLALFRRAGLLPPGGAPPSLASVLAQVDEDVLVCAHSHIAWTQEEDGKLVLNPGSVSGPNNGDVRAQYALLTWARGHWQATPRAVAYDLELIRAAYRDTGLLAAGGVMAEAFLLDILTAENVPGRLMAHTRQLAAEAGLVSGGFVPDELWQEAIATFDWGAGAGLARELNSTE